MIKGEAKVNIVVVSISLSWEEAASRVVCQWKASRSGKVPRMSTEAVLNVCTGGQGNCLVGIISKSHYKPAGIKKLLIFLLRAGPIRLPSFHMISFSSSSLSLSELFSA